MRASFRLLGGCLGSLLASSGCNQDPGADNGKGIDQPAPCPACVPDAGISYPAPPWAVTQGAIVPPDSFTGFVDAQTESSESQTIRFSDFYNPHAGDCESADPPADCSYPAGSQYGSGKKPRALYVDVSAGWCGPCQLEAKTTLPGLYAKYKPCGGEFFFQLAEGAATGAPATQALLGAWTSQFKVSYPATFDASQQLAELYTSGFPAGAIVDASTMKIVTVINGLPDESFWSTYESLLDAKCLAGE